MPINHERLSHYSETKSPVPSAYMVEDQQKLQHVNGEEDASYSLLESIFNGFCYLVGGICFLVGSIFFYSEYLDAFGNGGYLGAWLFEIGCVLFVLGTGQDLIAVRNEKLKDCVSAIIYFLGSVCFAVGSVYFFPEQYLINPSFGSLMFMVGCFGFCIGACIDAAGQLFRNSQDINDRTPRLSNMFKVIVVAWLFSFIGCSLFIAGCYYYLPENIGENYEFAVDLFVIGSVFFILGGAVICFDLYKNYNANKASLH